MTNTLTISRDQISVPREFLEVIANSSERSMAEINAAIQQARELLAAPVVERQEPVACSHEWTDDGEFTLVCTKCGREENHEPYGWVQTRGDSINDFTQEWDVVQEWEESGYEYKAMFDHTSPPAPVSADFAHDRAYRNGMMAGFQFGISGNEKGYAVAIANFNSEIRAAKGEQHAPVAVVLP